MPKPPKPKYLVFKVWETTTKYKRKGLIQLELVKEPKELWSYDEACSVYKELGEAVASMLIPGAHEFEWRPK